MNNWTKGQTHSYRHHLDLFPASTKGYAPFQFVLWAKLKMLFFSIQVYSLPCVHQFNNLTFQEMAKGHRRKEAAGLGLRPSPNSLGGLPEFISSLWLWSPPLEGDLY